MRPIRQTRRAFLIRLRRSRGGLARFTDAITDDTVETLRVRYAELLRLRRYVQRLEGLRQDPAGPKQRRARGAVAVERQARAAERVLQCARRIRKR